MGLDEVRDRPGVAHGDRHRDRGKTEAIRGTLGGRGRGIIPSGRCGNREVEGRRLPPLHGDAPQTDPLSISIVDGDIEGARRYAADLVMAFLIRLWSDLGEGRCSADYGYAHSGYWLAVGTVHGALYPPKSVFSDWYRRRVVRATGARHDQQYGHGGGNTRSPRYPLVHREITPTSAAKSHRMA